ncbi:MAG: hypothetical protein ABIN35_01095 [candidate division WOR-3 bacterium]
MNKIHNVYLFFKYYRYRIEDTKSKTNKKYHVTKILLTKINQPNSTKLLTKYNKIPIDLNYHKWQISCQNLYQSEYNYQFDHQTVIFIYYVYGDDEYILPFKFRPNGLIKFPLYSTEDLETSIKIEYNKIETKRFDSSNSQIMSLVRKYAGPKGNFYNDLNYFYEPELIYQFTDHLDSIEATPLLTENDYLKLYTIFDDQLTFVSDQPIKLPDSLFMPI